MMMVSAGGGGGGTTLTSINPTSYANGGPGFTLHCIGTGFVNGDAQIVVDGLGKATNWISSGDISCTFVDGALSAGPHNVLVNYNDGANQTTTKTLTIT
jgi:hypothetical protein